MKILKLSTRDCYGAGIAAVESLSYPTGSRVDAKLVVLKKSCDNPQVVGIYGGSTYDKFKLWLKLHIQNRLHHIKAINSRYEFHDRQVEMASAKKILKAFGEVPDVIEIYWVSNFVSFRTIWNLYELTKAKVVFIMTDNAPFTGGCHYPWLCNGYKNSCFPCPALKNQSRFAHRTLLLKKRYLPPGAIIVGTSQDCERARTSFLFKNNRVIPMVVLKSNPYEFKKFEGREKWNIQEGKYVIFCGASFLNEDRKGFKLLVEAINKISYTRNLSRVVILVSGEGYLQWPKSVQVITTGTLSEKELFMAFYTADLFVCPSVEDSGPMMVNYAFEANIPIVAYNIGVALDLISHKKNGYLCVKRNVDELVEGIVYCIEHKDELKQRIIQCNNDIKEHISLTKSYKYILSNYLEK